MFGKDDLMDNMSRGLHRARGRRDALASEVTTLTAQIAEMEGRLSEEKTRRERDRSLSEIEATKTRIKHATSELASVIRELSEAIEKATAVVPEAREFNNFLLAVAAEIDCVVAPLLHALDQRAAAVRVGQAVLDLPFSANEAPTERRRNSNDDRTLRFPLRLFRTKKIEEKEAKPPRSSVSHKCAARLNASLDVLQLQCSKYRAAFVAKQIVNKLTWCKRDNVLVTTAGDLDHEMADTRHGLLDNGVTASTKCLDADKKFDQSGQMASSGVFKFRLWSEEDGPVSSRTNSTSSDPRSLDPISPEQR